MTCAIITKHWTVYDAKTRKMLHLSHEEFKNLLLDRPVKLTSKFLNLNNYEKIWIDGLLNSDWFK